MGDLELDHERQVIRGNPREGCPHGFDTQDADRTADEDMIDTHEWQAGGKGCLGPRKLGLHLRIQET